MIYKECSKREGGFQSQKILEIGKGAGVVSAVLKDMGYDLKTMDINEHLHPDYVQNICALEDAFKKNQYDVILCAEVLEHIPFENFETAIKNIASMLKTDGVLVLTIPNCYLRLPVYINLPKIHFNKVLVAKMTRRIGVEHCWEIGSAEETNERNIKRILEKHFVVSGNGRIPFNEYHWWWICYKK